MEVENQPPSMAAELPSHLQSNQYNDSPVFYGPDGQIISEEESVFLNSNMTESYPINIDDIIECVLIFFVKYFMLICTFH